MNEFTLLKKAIDYSYNGILIFNGKGNLVYVNRSFLSLCGYIHDELAELSISEFAGLLFPGQTYHLPMETFASGAEVPDPGTKYTLRTKTGSEVPVHLSIFHEDWPDEQGHTGCLMLVNDIQPHVTASKWEAKAGFLSQVVKSGIIAVNQAQVITIFNEAAEQMTGLKKQEVLGRPYDALFSQVEFADRYLINALVYGIEVQAQEVTRCPCTQREGNFVISSAQLKNVYNDVMGAILLIQDITEQRWYEKEFTRAERLAVVSEVAAGMAHEIRNPLTTVKGFIQLLSNRVEKGSREKEYFDLILEELNRANQLISDFLMLTKPQEKAMVNTNINNVLNQITMLLESQAFLHGIEIARQFDDSIPDSLMEFNQIKQVFLNLVRNAIQAMPNGGRLTLKSQLKKEENSFVVDVIDTGCGIPPEHLPKLFTPFFSTKETGTGLGLSLSHRIVRNHGGSIEIQSAENVGTTLTVHLPLKQTQQPGEPSVLF